MGILNVDMMQMTIDAEGFSHVSAKANEISSYMKNALRHLGNFWGNDKVGSEFIAEWDRGVQGLFDTLTGVHDGMRYTGDGVKLSADLYKKSNVINTGLAG